MPSEAVGCRQGMIRRLGRPRTVTPMETEGPLVLQINKRLSARLRDVARANGAHSVESWCEMALETYVVDHRSGKPPVVPVGQYTARQDEEVW